MEKSDYKLVYCFSKKLSDSNVNFEKILYCLKKSIEFNSRFHLLKVITDKETYIYLKDLIIDIQVYQYGEFRFLDDIKIQTLPLLADNEILIDPDIFLHTPLSIDKNCDLLLERPEQFSAPWYKEDCEDSKPFKFAKLIKFYSISGEVGNIGIIKFFNKNFQQIYIDHYNEIKKVTKEENQLLPPFPKFSVIIGQLALQNLTDEYKFSVKYCKQNKNNNYIHLSGYRKYSIETFIDRMTIKSVI